MQRPFPPLLRVFSFSSFSLHLKQELPASGVTPAKTGVVAEEVGAKTGEGIDNMAREETVAAAGAESAMMAEEDC